MAMFNSFFYVYQRLHGEYWPCCGKMLNNGHWVIHGLNEMDIFHGDIVIFFKEINTHKNIRSIGINWIGFKCQISVFLNIHIYIYICVIYTYIYIYPYITSIYIYIYIIHIYAIYIYTPYIWIYSRKCQMSFLFSRTFRKKPAPIPRGEPLLLFLGREKFSGWEKTACMVGIIYCIYILYI